MDQEGPVPMVGECPLKVFVEVMDDGRVELAVQHPSAVVVEEALSIFRGAVMVDSWEPMKECLGNLLASFDDARIDHDAQIRKGMPLDDLGGES